MERIRFANTFVDKISLEGVVNLVAQNIAGRKKTHIVFLNALKISEINKNPAIKKAMHEAELILADGVPIVWFSKLFGNALPGRVNGTDLFEKLLEWANNNSKKIFLLGATEENVNLLAIKLRKDYPNLGISLRNGYYKDHEDEQVINQINSTNSDILFVGFSSPKKEVWVNKYKDKLNIPIIQGVGGSFDVLAGKISRAPKWMQNSGLEWLYRVLKEPRRMFIRYMKTNFIFLLIMLKYMFLQKKVDN